MNEQTKCDVRSFITKRSFEIARQEIEAQGKYSSEEVEDMAMARCQLDPHGYMILALIDYLEQL